MTVETLSDYVQVRLWLRLIEKTAFKLSGKACEISDENVKALHICDWTVTNTVTQYIFNHHK